jgi:hypothetical protein
VYIELACRVESEDLVRARLAELARDEAGILQESRESGPDTRLHS